MSRSSACLFLSLTNHIKHIHLLQSIHPSHLNVSDQRSTSKFRCSLGHENHTHLLLVASSDFVSQCADSRHESCDEVLSQRSVILNFKLLDMSLEATEKRVPLGRSVPGSVPTSMHTCTLWNIVLQRFLAHPNGCEMGESLALRD